MFCPIFAFIASDIVEGQKARACVATETKHKIRNNFAMAAYVVEYVTTFTWYVTNVSS